MRRRPSSALGTGHPPPGRVAPGSAAGCLCTRRRAATRAAWTRQAHTCVHLVLLRQPWGTWGHLIYRTLGSGTGLACVLRGSFLLRWFSRFVLILPAYEPCSSLVCRQPPSLPSAETGHSRAFPSAATLTSGGRRLRGAPLSLPGDGQMDGGEPGSQKRFEGPRWNRPRSRCRGGVSSVSHRHLQTVGKYKALHRHSQHGAVLLVCPLSALVRGSHSFQEATDLLVLKFPRKKKTKI